MPKFFVLLLAACSLAAAGQTTQAAEPSAAAMPREKAKATFEDPRFLRFLKNVQDGFKVRCTPPDPGNTNAKVTLPNPITKDAPLDAAGFASTWYEVTVPCSELTTVTVHAEFTPLSGDKPLTLVLSLSQALKR
jgi:hypothetical protein